MMVLEGAMSLGEVPGSPESWWERYGAVGAVAFISIVALVFALKQFFSERAQDRQRQNRDADELDKRNTALNDKLVEVVRAGHTETLKLLEDQAARHEERYQALLERHMTESRQHAEALRAQSAAMAEAINAVVKKTPRS